MICYVIFKFTKTRRKGPCAGKDEWDELGWLMCSVYICILCIPLQLISSCGGVLFQILMKPMLSP